MRNLILVFAFFIVSACGCQKTVAPIEAVKVEASPIEASTTITIKGTDYNCDQIIVNPLQPLNECGILKDCKITVRDIVCHSTTVKENQIIAGVLYITGEAYSLKPLN